MSSQSILEPLDHNPIWASERDEAREIQQSLLPAAMLEGGWEFTASWVAGAGVTVKAVHDPIHSPPRRSHPSHCRVGRQARLLSLPRIPHGADQLYGDGQDIGTHHPAGRTPWVTGLRVTRVTVTVLR